VTVTTPLPSAAAAVALWLLEPSSSFITETAPGSVASTTPSASSAHADDIVVLDVRPQSAAFVVFAAAQAESSLAADYISWHLAQSGRPEAFDLGLSMLPAPLDPNLPRRLQPPRVHYAGQRASGAMLLALAARSNQQKEQARARLAARLEGGPLGVRPPFMDATTYQCGLLALGEQRHCQAVFNAMLSGTFPIRRALTALTASGDRGVLDWLLCDARDSDAGLSETIVRMALGEPLAAATAPLPQIDLAAPDDVRAWQTRILRDGYVLRRQP
jgi:hypothetical protein